MFEEFEKKENVDLKTLSTMKVGGVGKWLLFPKNSEEIKKILKICKKNNIKTLILGNGSNILFLDEGFDGAIISLKHFDFIRVIEKTKKNKVSNNGSKTRFFYVFLSNLDRKASIFEARKVDVKTKNMGFKAQNKVDKIENKNNKIKTIKKYKKIDNKYQKNNKKIIKINYFYNFYLKKARKYGRYSQKTQENSKKIGNKLKIAKIKVKNGEKMRKKPIFLEIGAGVNLFALNLRLKELDASGLEFCYGIPATLGGFVYMNGGCFGHEIGEFVQEVKVISEGEVKVMKKEELTFSYRHSSLQEKNCIILSAKLGLFAEKSEIIEKNMSYFLNLKRNAQPCNMASLGSVFKKVGDISPSKIIDELGLKGFSIGGAQVSTLHAGFIVNTGAATSDDVLALIDHLKRALRKEGCEVECEIVIAP